MGETARGERREGGRRGGRRHLHVEETERENKKGSEEKPEGHGESKGE